MGLKLFDPFAQPPERRHLSVLGDKPITDITGVEILEVIRKIEARGSIEMASRIYDMVRRIYRFAKAEGQS